jgi:hypothetical protein
MTGTDGAVTACQAARPRARPTRTAKRTVDRRRHSHDRDALPVAPGDRSELPDRIYLI